MTTSVTEAVRREGSPDLPFAGISDIKADPALAQQVARQLLHQARSLAPHIDWTFDNLKDVLVVATEGVRQEGHLLEGRQLRKHLREMVARADRYRERFTLAIISLVSDIDPRDAERVADGVADVVRRSDKVCAYKRRVVLTLPFMTDEQSLRLLKRFHGKLPETLRHQVVDFHSLQYPGEYAESTQDVLDWLEDHLR